MAQQTINVGAAPNDGTGTPLRTAFQYTNSNFTELYTALGGGAGLPGATTQVIFNDGGTNLAGDAGLTYNKTTDTLSMGAATITGDLTVNTNTLKTTSGNVGIGTVTPDIFSRFYTRTIGFNSTGSSVMQINGTSYGGIDIGAAGTRTFGMTASGTDVNFGSLTNIPVVFNINGSEAMRLNSTGLGIGASPSYKLDVLSSGVIAQFLRDLTIDTGIQLQADNSGSIIKCIGNQGLRFNISNTEVVNFDSSGNLGLGVTPAAAVVNNRKLEIAGDINSAVVLGSKSANASARNWATASNWNAYGDLVFLQSNAVGGDPLAAGTTRMTLNSNGALVLQGGTAAANGVGIAFPATQSASSDAKTLDDYEEGTWTPTIAAETGTIGSTSIISANYTKIGRLVSVTFDIRVITAGTGSGGLKVSLPFSPSLGGQTCGAGREYINTGYMLQISKYDATNVLVYFYNNTTMIADNNRVMAGYTYFI